MLGVDLELRIALRQESRGIGAAPERDAPAVPAATASMFANSRPDMPEPLGHSRQYRARRRRYAVAGQRRAQLQLHERAQQVVAQAAGLAQPLDAELGIVAGRLAGPEAGRWRR